MKYRNKRPFSEDISKWHFLKRIFIANKNFIAHFEQTWKNLEGQKWKLFPLLFFKSKMVWFFKKVWLDWREHRTYIPIGNLHWEISSYRVCVVSASLFHMWIHEHGLHGICWQLRHSAVECSHLFTTCLDST